MENRATATRKTEQVQGQKADSAVASAKRPESFLKLQAKHASKR